MDKQATFEDFGGSAPRRQGTRMSTLTYETGVKFGLIHPEPSLEDGSCPWCLAPTSEFEDQPEEYPGEVVCTFCNSIIPVHMDWYRRGEKIVI